MGNPMSEILQDLSAPALVAAIKANQLEWWRALGSSPEAEFYDSPEVTWLLTCRPTAAVNTVLLSQVEPEEVGVIIERTRAHFESRGVTTVSWSIQPGSQAADLGPQLVEHGLTYREGAPGMAVDLWALNEDLPTPAGLAIELVEDTEALRKWAHVSVLGFGLPEAIVDPWFELFAALGFDQPLRNYLGTLNGQPVATSQLLLGAGVAGIYVVGTLPEARRQGIGAAISLAPLRDARALGYRVGILHASRLGEGVYRRLGFQEYCRMSHYQ
jgi:GNAT superfamily N-acetyltransferase